MSMWACSIQTDVSLSAATAKTVYGLKAPTGAIIELHEIHVDFESVTAADGPALIEIVRGAADGTGTPETPVNLKGGHTATASFTAASNYTVEPISLTVVREYQYPVQGSVDIPLAGLGSVVESAVAGFLGVRITTPQAQSCRVSTLVRA